MNTIISIKKLVFHHLKFAQFVWKTVIRPWPPFVFILALTGLIGAVQPLIHIAATQNIIDMLIAHMADETNTTLSLYTQIVPFEIY